VLQITPTQQDTPRWVGAFMSLHTWPYFMHVALLVALYVGTAKLGLSLHAVGGFATAVWPPTGLALVALVLGGSRLWPGIALGAYLVNVWAGAPLLVAAGMALGNTFEALLGAAFLRHVVRFRPALDRLRDVAGLVGAALLSTLVSATVGVTSGWLGGVIATDVYDEAWRTWWLGDMNGDLVVAALLLTWSTRPKTIVSSRLLLEGAGLLLTVVTLGLLVFTRSMATDIIVDITKRKQAEAQLQASLHEKEVLLKEIHHRVKNNLQVIASLLYLQSDQLKDPEDVALFEDTQNRVKSMALVHESLSRTGDLAHFNFAHYIESLTTYLFQSHVAEVSRISLDMELDEIVFDVDTAIPCGLILNELLTNALKYAFPDGRSGNIHITLRAAAEQATLSVRDTGIGFPEGFDFRNTESLGLQLVGMMTEQLRGDADTHAWRWHHVYRQYSLWRAIGEGGRACPRPRF
jgi:two-component sensor histidine kinase